MSKFFKWAIEKHPLTIGIGFYAFLSFSMVVFIWHVKPANMIAFSPTSTVQQ